MPAASGPAPARPRIARPGPAAPRRECLPVEPDRRGGLAERDASREQRDQPVGERIPQLRRSTRASPHAPGFWPFLARPTVWGGVQARLTCPPPPTDS